MKKLFALLLALVVCLTLVACGGGNKPTGGNGADPGQQQEQQEQQPSGGSTHTASTDYFWEKYDFTEEWMLPDGGVYTGYQYIDPAENEAENEGVYVYVYEVTQQQYEDYIKKVESQGYSLLIGDAYSKTVDGKSCMIEIKYYDDEAHMQILIDPSI